MHAESKYLAIYTSALTINSITTKQEIKQMPRSLATAYNYQEVTIELHLRSYQ